jgi:hypothetical protein
MMKTSFSRYCKRSLPALVLLASLSLSGRAVKAQEIQLWTTARSVLQWNDVGSGASRNGSFWAPSIPAEQGVYPFSHSAVVGYGQPPIITVGKAITQSALAFPVDFAFIWNDSGSGADMDGAFWTPIPPLGYVTLGTVVTSGAKPALSSVVCVRSDLAVQASVLPTWDDSGSGADHDFSAWAIVPPDGGIELHTFVGTGTHSPPTVPVYCLKASAVAFVPPPAPTQTEIEQLIEANGPIVKFHPDETAALSGGQANASQTYQVTVTRGSSTALQDVTQPGDPIVSLPPDRSPAGEGVRNVIDNDATTKYLNTGDHVGFYPPQSGITGFTVTPKAGASVVTGLGLTSANDVPERDPASYRLEGSTGGATFTLIAQGSVPAFSGRFTRQEILFVNLGSYKTYRLPFPTVANVTTGGSMQIAEVELLRTITVGPAPSSDADLASLVPSAGSLAPVFASGSILYTVSVANATTSMTFTPTVAETNAKVKVNGVTVTSGAASRALNLAVGSNPITVAVTAQDGATVKNYVVTVTRADIGTTEPTLLITDRLQLWLKADAGALTDAAGGVTSWADQSGKGNHATQSDSSKAPDLILNALNGKPVLRFNGTNDYLDVADAPSIRITGDISSFVVVRFDDFAGYQAIWSKATGNLPAPTDWYLFNGTGVPIAYRGDGTYSNLGSVPANQPVTAGTYLILGFEMGGATLTHYLNGLSIGSGQITATPADAGKALRIGSRDDLGTIMKGDLAEVLIYDRALSDTDRTAVLDYLNSRYALQILPPTLSIRAAGANLTLTWSNGTLQEATDLDGTWQNVTGTSPLDLAPVGIRKFYKAK